MEKFTNEEFKKFSEKLINELKAFSRAAEGELIDASEIENDTLKELLNMYQEVMADESKYTEDFEKESAEKLRDVISVDRMTDEQFESIINDETFKEYFLGAYDRAMNKEAYERLSSGKRDALEASEKLRSMKGYIESGRYTDFLGAWEKLSASSQAKYFDEIMSMPGVDRASHQIWMGMKAEVQQAHENMFKSLLDKSRANDDLVKSLWVGTCSDVQKNEFSYVMGNFADDFKKNSELWKVTDKSVQQEFFKDLIGKSKLSIPQRVSVLNNLAPEVKKDNENYIFRFCDQVNQKLSEEQNSQSNDKKNELMISLWGALGGELQNSEKGKELFFQNYENANQVDSENLMMRTSKEFIEQNFAEIIERRNEYSDLQRLMWNLEGIVSDDTIIDKKNFSYLYQLNNDGKTLDENVYAKIRELYNFNHDMVHNIDYRFLSIDDLLNTYSDEQLLRITNYPEVQNYIYTECYEKNNIALRECLKDLLDSDSNWILSLQSVMTNTKTFGTGSSQYTKLIENMANVGEEEITDEFKQQLLGVLQQDKNYFEINTYEDVCDYTNIRNDVCQKIFDGDFENIPDTIKKNFRDDKDGLYKFALLEHQFGITLKDAERIVNYYGDDVKDFPDGEIKDYLSLLKDVINCKDIESVIGKVNEQIKDGTIQPWKGSVDSRNVEGQIINVFENMLNEVTYNPENGKKTREETYVDAKGKEHKIEIQDLDQDFYMRARVEGAYRSMDKNSAQEDYNKYYARPSMKNHGNCESLIRQDCIACARPNAGSIMVGFSEVRKNQLTMMAPYDIGSSNDTFSSYNYHMLPGSKEAKYRVPNQMINNTRHPHNELVNDRYYTDDDGNIQKLKPDFIIWIEEDLSEAQGKIDDATKKAAADLGVPIVVVNRERMAQRETAKLEVLNKLISGEEVTNPEYQQYVDEYKDLSMPELIKEVITKYGNNRTGLQYAQKIQDKYFTAEQFKDTMSIIEKRIETMDFESKKECVDALNNVCNKEYGEAVREHFLKETEGYWHDFDSYMGECSEKYRQKAYEMKEVEAQQNGIDDSQKKKALLQQYLDQDIDVTRVNEAAKELKREIEEKQKQRGTNNDKEMNI